MKVGDGGWNETLDVKVAKGASVTFGPHPWDGKIWSWEGPDGFKSTTRENTLKNLDGTKSGYYTVTYTNETGCKSVAKIKIVVDDPDHPYKEPDSTTTAIGKRTRESSRDLHLKRNPIYFDLLGNRLKSKPKNGMFVVK